MQGESPHQTVSEGAIACSPYLGGDTLVLQVCELVKEQPRVCLAPPPAREPHVQGAVAVRAQEGQEEPLHVQGQEGQR